MAKPNWITVNPSSGVGAGIFKITFAQNTSTSSRSGIVTVKSLSGLTREIQVTQAGKATKGKITFIYTGNEISQKFVGYTLYLGISNDTSTEFYANYGTIESITDTDLTVNFDNYGSLEENLATINGDMADLDELYLGVSISNDPTISWIPLLFVNDPGNKEFTNQNMAAKLQSAFNGTNEIISSTSVAPSEPTDVICS